DSVSGLAGDPSRDLAVARISEIKARPAGLELTLLAASLDAVQAAVDLSATARQLADRYWPGPLSIVSPVRRSDLAIPRNATTLSCRIPDHALLLHLLQLTGPLASTSANRHGELPATTAQQVWEPLGDELDVILDGG